jgi:quercetin dioxygenase-like cupin family protein
MVGKLKLEPGDFTDAWIEGDETARWRSAVGHGPSQGAESSGSSILEVEPGRRLPPHTDSAEEAIAVLAGRARVTIDDQTADVSAGELALVPAGAKHQVENVGAETLHFVAFYAGTDVVTRYEDEVQPDGSSERRPVR